MPSILTPNIVSLLITTAFNALLAFFILSKNRKSPINRLFSLLAIGVALWSFTNIATQLVKTVQQGILWSQISYLSTLIIALSFFLFSIIFPEDEKITKSKFFIPAIIVTIIIAILIFIPKFVIETVIISPWKIITNNGIYLYAISFVAMLILSFINILKKYRLLKKEQKTQIKFVLIGTFTTAVIGIFFNLVLPIFFKYYGLVWFGPNAALVMVGFIAYAVIKHHLFDIKVIATEIFSILISFSALIDALLSQTPTEFILKLMFFSAISLFSILLIRGVLKEVKTREELAALTEKLQTANEDLKKLDKAKSEFISIASHQLRTPLSIIKGFASMLEEGSYGQMNEKAKDILGKIGTSSDRLTRLINDLLDLSRMEGGRMKFEWEFVKLDELVESVVEELAPQAEKKGVNFKWLNQAPEKMYVRADKEKLRQVVMNLIDNAIKYTPKGFVEVKLVKTPENQARFSVKDSGIGMDQEEMQMIFGKFVRGKKVPRLWTEGVGLGLYVAKKILEEHKGTIWAESEGEGKGSTFFVEIPVY